MDEEWLIRFDSRGAGIPLKMWIAQLSLNQALTKTISWLAQGPKRSTKFGWRGTGIPFQAPITYNMAALLPSFRNRGRSGRASAEKLYDISYTESAAASFQNTVRLSLRPRVLRLRVRLSRNCDSKMALNDES